MKSWRAQTVKYAVEHFHAISDTLIPAQMFRDVHLQQQQHIQLIYKPNESVSAGAKQSTNNVRAGITGSN